MDLGWSLGWCWWELHGIWWYLWWWKPGFETIKWGCYSNIGHSNVKIWKSSISWFSQLDNFIYGIVHCHAWFITAIWVLGSEIWSNIKRIEMSWFSRDSQAKKGDTNEDWCIFPLVHILALDMWNQQSIRFNPWREGDYLQKGWFYTEGFN